MLEYLRETLPIIDHLWPPHPDRSAFTAELSESRLPSLCGLQRGHLRPSLAYNSVDLSFSRVNVKEILM